MPLSVGSRLGQYEIVSGIGAGGPACARAQVTRELRRGLAVAQPKPRP